MPIFTAADVPPEVAQDAAARMEMLARVKRLLNPRLPMPPIDALVEWWEGKTITDIAQRMRKPRRTVSDLIRNGRQRLIDAGIELKPPPAKGEREVVFCDPAAINRLVVSNGTATWVDSDKKDKRE